MAFFARIFKRFSKPPKSSVSDKSQQPLQALRQLNQHYLRQKRLWVYIVLSAMSLLIIYVLFSVFWAGLRAHAIPIAWIVLAGILIAVFQVRRCNDLILALRQAHQVQFQIEKAQAEKAKKERAQDAQEEAQTRSEDNEEGHGPISSNGSQKPSDMPEI